MNTTQNRRLWLLILASLTLLMLLIFPATRWIVREQAAAELLQGGPKSPRDVLHSVAVSHPNDFEFQFADAVEHDPGKLTEIAARFPDHTFLFAAIIRHTDKGGVFLPEDYLMGGVPLPSEDKRHNSISPEELQTLINAAEQGERLDSDNAYFSYMLAWGLFGTHHDTEALDAVRRAGHKQHWNDYIYDEFKARYKLDQAAFGERGSYTILIDWALTMTMFNSRIRQMARVITYRAVEAEQQGRAAEGVELRHALMHYGSLMRLQSQTIIDNLVGLAIVALGTERPGGVAVVKRDINAPLLPNDPASRQKRTKEKLEKYYAYLRSINREDEARWAQAELEGGMKQKAMISKAFDKSPMLTEINRVAIAWGVSLFTLFNLISMLILGGAAVLAQKLHPKRGVKILRVVFFLTLSIGLFCWQNKAFNTAQHAILPIAAVDTSSSEDGDASFQNLIVMYLVIGSISLAVPMLVVLVLSISSRIYRVPIATGVGRGLRGVAVPIACILMLVYGTSILATSREEKRENVRLLHMIQHEGRYYAEAAGKTWPAAVPELKMK